MANKDTKQHRTSWFFFLLFPIILMVMLIVNLSNRDRFNVQGPVGGVKQMYSYGNELIAVSGTGETYIWDWNNLTKPATINSTKNNKLLTVCRDGWITVPFKKDELLLSNISDGNRITSLDPGYGKKPIRMKPSVNGECIGVIFEVEHYKSRSWQLAKVDCELTDIEVMAEKRIEEGIELYDLAISNDGSILTVVGGGQKGWIFVSDSNAPTGSWQYEMSDCLAFNKVALSPDGSEVYVSDSSRRVYVFDVRTGKILKHFEAESYETPANNPQIITCITFNDDGSYLAFASSPSSKVFVYDIKTGSIVTTINAGCFCVSGLAFSRDTNRIAISDLTTRPVRITEISEGR